MEFSTPYRYVGVRKPYDAKGSPSVTKQGDRDMANINKIMERIRRTGVVPYTGKVPLPSDFDGVVDYQESLNLLIEGRRAFEALPAKVRKEFDNDPGKFLTFYASESNDAKRAEIARLGIAKVLPEMKDGPDLAVMKEIRDGIVKLGGGSVAGSSSGGES